MENRGRAWVDMMLRDEGLVRLIYRNLHQVAEGVWRSGQPLPWHLRAFARQGGKTVISLRAGRDFGSLPLEVEACERAGLTYLNLPIRTFALPSQAEFRDIPQTLANAQKPMLMHCQSGADRSGFAAALYLALVEGTPVSEARKQLNWRFGHNRLGRAGLLSAFFDAYQRDTAETPAKLMEWIETSYDPEAIAKGFTPMPWTSQIAGYLGRR